jgi:hypothetical protein
MIVFSKPAAAKTRRSYHKRKTPADETSSASVRLHHETVRVKPLL